MTVTSFFAETPPPQKPDENAGGGGGQEALKAAAASYQVASATAATMSLAAVTTVNPSALQINIPQAISKGEAKVAPVAPVSTVAKAAPTAGSGGGIGGGNGSGVGDGNGNGQGNAGPLPPGYKQIGKIAIDTADLLVVLATKGSTVNETPARDLAGRKRGRVLEENWPRVTVSAGSFGTVETIIGTANALDAKNIYWTTFFRGGIYPPAIKKLREFVLEKGIKLYVSCWNSVPGVKTELVADLCRESGGAFEQCIALEKWTPITVRLTEKAWKRYQKILTMNPSETKALSPEENALAYKLGHYYSETLTSEDGQGRVWSAMHFGTVSSHDTLTFLAKDSTTSVTFQKEDIEPESWAEAVETDKVRAEQRVMLWTDHKEVKKRFSGTREMVGTVDKTLPDAETPEPEPAEAQVDGGDQKQASK